MPNDNGKIDFETDAEIDDMLGFETPMERIQALELAQAQEKIWEQHAEIQRLKRWQMDALRLQTDMQKQIQRLTKLAVS